MVTGASRPDSGVRLDGGLEQLNPSAYPDADEYSDFRILCEDSDRIVRRALQRTAEGSQRAVLAVFPAAEPPTPASLARLAHEYELKDELDARWAVRPLELVNKQGRPMLVLEDSGGEPLERLLDAPMEPGRFLRLAIAIVTVLSKAHQRGLIHKDLKPVNILVNSESGEVRLTSFGIATRLPRERYGPEPPEVIAGTLVYMAPEQTGRMNRSIDTRSDLYALGVTFYRMLTSTLPFTASDPMDWVHCHIARKPLAPAERLPRILPVVSAIVMKLLAKTPEERYQTAAGLERDLQRCLVDWEAQNRIDDFPLGQLDTPDRILIPETLYGRGREVEALLAAFDRVVKSGVSELVLVSGYSGIGKSSVVNELHKVMVSPRGLFASGKFDQYKRDIPYATLTQALQSLVRSLLVKSDRELDSWREALLEALGPNARLMTDLVPELKLIIGEPPPMPELEPQQAKGRFQIVFRRFIGVFARPEHPLALFLDDLQWLDGATLDLLEDLVTRSELQHLLLLGAYRDNEVDVRHPLRRRLETIAASGGKITEITLGPLTQEHLGQLIADALRCGRERAAPLAQLVQEKTDGNPFFAIQFLSSLAQEGLLAFDHKVAHWSWELERIHAQGYTDNVVDLMVGRVTRLPTETQTALQQLACLGNVATTTGLSTILGCEEEQVHSDLWAAVREELVERINGAYRFVHDRIQEAAYSLIPVEQRAATHLRIGRLLVAQTHPEKREQAIFDIVNQLNRGVSLITGKGEREQLAEFNLIAGKRAKVSTAYAAALNYLSAGAALLPQDCWERRYELAFALEINRAECEFLTSALEAAEQRLLALSSHAANLVDQAAVACLRVDLYVTLDQSGRAVAVGLEYLRHLGIEWSLHPNEEEARREYERIRSQLVSRTIEELIELPMMSDPAFLATLNVLIRVCPPAMFTDANLYSLVICRAVSLSLERGHSDASCLAYSALGMIAGPRYADYKAGFRFGQLGYELVEQRGLKRLQAGTYLLFGGHVMPWTRHLRAGRDLMRRAFEAANQAGDLTHAAYCSQQLSNNLLAASDPLIDVQREAEQGLVFAQKARFGLAIDRIAAQLGLIRTLRGLTPKFGFFNEEQFDELRMERRFAENTDLAFAECWYWIRKLQARYLAGDYASALVAASSAQRLLWTSVAHFETAEWCFYAALARAAAYDFIGSADERQQHLEALAAHHRQLTEWAENCPENFDNCASIVGAEIARIQGRELEAERWYERAIRSARDNGFVQNEAIAYELASRFYRARGFEQFAHFYLRNARNCYLRWGADGKVRQLEELYPQLRDDLAGAGTSSTIAASVEQLDLAAIIKVSQAVSSEIVFDKLIDTLMRNAIEQAGAERGLLILSYGPELSIAAEATTSGDIIAVQLHDKPVTDAELPESALQYVLRTRENVILDDAAGLLPFAEDSYVRRCQARSILCLPLLNQAKLVGVLYLENNLAPRVFAPARTALLKVLASQAAIALENTRLYREIAAREARIRRLVDANIIGIFMADAEDRIIEANDAFLRIVGYDREDLAAGRIRWTELTPPEWLERDAQQWKPEFNRSRVLPPFEKEYFRKDGSRVPVLIGVAGLEDARTESVTFVLDLSERKRAEETLLTLQTELAHANRITSIGQLTASIAHEVNQPLAATVTNARAALRFLDRQPPDLEEVRQALGDIVETGHRAGEIIARVRALVKKAPLQTDCLDINEVVREVVELTAGEAVKNGVSVQTVFADGLLLIDGDRVQLQQVLVNLIMNAIEAMSGTSAGARELRISTRKTERDDVLVGVWDSGPGLAPGALDHLFDAFYTTKPGGLGLGLSICRSIIEAHSGRLWATPNVPKGAVFEFTVPVHSDITL